MKKWIMDSNHCVAAFRVRHLLVTNVHGQFNNVSGVIFFDPEGIAHSSVEAKIDVNSIHTGVRKRDDHLLSPDFLDAANNPEIQFKSTRMENSGENRFRIFGDLTIRGITRPVTLEAEFSGPIKAPFGDEMVMGFLAGTQINRFDFNVSWNEGEIVVDKDVYITLGIEADLMD